MNNKKLSEYNPTPLEKVSSDDGQSTIAYSSISHLSLRRPFNFRKAEYPYVSYVDHKELDDRNSFFTKYNKFANGLTGNSRRIYHDNLICMSEYAENEEDEFKCLMTVSSAEIGSKVYELVDYY